MTISRRTFNGFLLASTAASAWPLPARSETGAAFAHPGMLHNAADLARMREAVASKSQPIYAGFEIMRKHPASSATYKSAGASVEIGRNPNVRFQYFDQDANAAYQCALMWCITGDKAFAATAIGILNDWSGTLKKITGLDAILCASLGGFKMVNAAELLRCTASGWEPADARRAGQMFTEVLLPVIFNFAAFANGNWDTAAIKIMLAIAIYMDDRPLFDRAIVYYLHGCGDGRLEHYIYPTGQCQESGRDQQHTQLGIAHMGDACEMAWHQGLDLYSDLDNRLLLGFEYTAQYELGGDVPFVPDIDQTGKYRHAIISPRSALRSVYEQIFNHYTRRRGIPAHFTGQAAEKLRPEGAPFQADATGYGTLLYTRPAGHPEIHTGLKPQTVLHAEGTAAGVVLTFVPPSSGAVVTLERADSMQGPWRRVARGSAGVAYNDRTGESGRLYRYRAVCSGGQASLPVSSMRGLPKGWRPRNPGNLDAHASSDGANFSLTAGGAQSAATGGPVFSVEHSVEASATLTARVYPLLASSFAGLGLILNGSSSETLLHVSPKSGPPEHPAWAASLLARGPGAAAEIVGSTPVGAPVIVNGRLTSALWLRLQVTPEGAHASISPDGDAWNEVAAIATPPGPLSVGLFAYSGVESITTEVLFDHVALTA
jgi:hypothetical protein